MLVLTALPGLAEPNRALAAAMLAELVPLAAARPAADHPVVSVVVAPGEQIGSARALLPHGEGWIVELGLNSSWVGRTLTATEILPRWGLCLRSRTVLATDLVGDFVEHVCACEPRARPRFDDALLVVTELLANAVLHGNLQDLPPDRAAEAWLDRGVALAASLTGRALSFTVSQETGFYPSSARLEEADPAEFQALLGESSGRGLMIVASLCISVIIGADRRSCRAIFDVPPAVSVSD